MASVAVDPQLSVVTRVINLPLVSSTYDLMSSAYLSTKDQYPYLKSVCEMAEKGVKTITSVAMTSALPIIQKLEPQIAVANIYACKGLDRIEERLPILNQPSTQANTCFPNLDLDVCLKNNGRFLTSQTVVKLYL
uniref:Perilipin 2 n=1 Tax=Rhinopithecus roxellana TaxID=61622 RepID=A0A2K6QQG2_RHIRO